MKWKMAPASGFLLAAQSKATGPAASLETGFLPMRRSRFGTTDKRRRGDLSLLV
jgi:hypothetical protein